MKISIDKNIIRSFTVNDFNSFAKHANNPKIAAKLQNRFPYPFTEEDAKIWIRQAVSERKNSDFAIATADEVIGGIGFNKKTDVFHKSAEAGYWIAEPYWGQGIATKALKAIVNYAFQDFDLIRIYASPFECNPASARVLEKSGFQYEGRLRKSAVKNSVVLDQLMYSIIRDEWEASKE